MDYGRFKYETEQRAKESRRKTTQVSIKEMKYRVKIGPGDFDTKTRKVLHFLGEGHKVKITIMFRGRELDHPHLGKQILDRIADQAKDVAKVEVMPKLDGRNMLMVLAPDKRAQAAAAKPHEDGAPDDASEPQGVPDQAPAPNGAAAEPAPVAAAQTQETT